MRLLQSLAFVPPDDVIRCYEEILESEYYQENQETLAPILDYFEQTWIGKKTRGKSRTTRSKPQFAIALWNCYNSVLNDLARTNNIAEAWHNRFSHLIEGSHVSLWKFLSVLIEEEHAATLRMEQLLSGSEPAKKRRRHIDHNARLKSLVKKYDSNVIKCNYLRGIAYNLRL